MASPGSEAGLDDFPPPPPTIPPNVVPSKAIEPEMPEPPKRHPMARPGVGCDGRPVRLLSNHFRVKFNAIVFYHYSISIKSQDKLDVEGKGLGRKVIDKLYLTCGTDLDGKYFAYDGEKSLFTVGALPAKHLKFTVILEESSARTAGGSPGNGSSGDGDRKRSKRSHQPRAFEVEINYAARIPMPSITDAIEGWEAKHSQDALRVLDIILRQQQAKRGCLLVRQSFFNSDVTNNCNLGGGVTVCRGFHSSFRTTNAGLSLNMDVSTTMIMTPGPVVDFLLANQNISDVNQIEWTQAKQMLKNMRIQTTHNKMEFKITGISEFPCNKQFFHMRVSDGVDGQTRDITVYDYFCKKNIKLDQSAHLPCLAVGKPKRLAYLPVELCWLLPLQRYRKALSSQQRVSLLEKSRQKPQERIRVVTDAVQSNRYDEDPMLKACGISIEKELTDVDGRVLAPPKLRFGNNVDTPQNGRWNFNNKEVVKATTIGRWAIVNFSARCDIRHLSRELIDCARTKGIQINHPRALIEEEKKWNRSGPVERVEKMLKQVMKHFSNPPQFLLCVLPERKNSDIYGPWKKKNLLEVGIVTQCIAPNRPNNQYLTNVLLKINSKLGGVNSFLAYDIPLVSDVPTLILGMDVSHGSPGRADPSIAAVVGSRCWPHISTYRASVRTQAPKVEMIDCLYSPQANGKDDGIIRELLMEFHKTSDGRKPSQVIIFRDGVSESQFNQVLNIELNQICKAFTHSGDTKLPKFTVIVAQKNHHTKLFQSGMPGNVQPGTVVDTKVVHPRHYDFYMCAHAGMIGTSRPTHYHVLLDEIGFSADAPQQLVHSLSYVYQRSTTAISTVAPVRYAHLAAAQASHFIKFEDFSETSSGHGGGPAIPELPPLHKNVQGSMFFC